MEIDKPAILSEMSPQPGLIHLDNAGASLMPDCVLQAQIALLQLEGKIGGYQSAAQCQVRIEKVYDSVARLLNCHRDEVAIVENATVGWMMAFYALSFQPGDRILTAEAEYASNYLAYLQICQKTGAVVETIASTETGEVCVESLESMIDDRVKLISITHVPTNGGLVNPVEAIGAVARKHDIFYLVDACQSAGQVVLDVEAIQCDVLSATGRKYLRGPRGVGFLYVNKRILDQMHPPMIDLYSASWTSADSYELRGDARRFENWENNYAAKLGLGTAVDYALELGLENIEVEVSRIAALLRQKLSTLENVTVQDIGKQKCGIVTFSIAGHESHELAEKIIARNINVSVTTPLSTLIDASRRNLPDMVRSSVHYFNQESELDRFIEVLQEILQT
ncbi:MAG: aminotransferase class V-fold PLP-dependent enzyme [Pseudomonadota bacterium]